MAWDGVGIREQVKGNGYHLTHECPTFPPRLSKAPGIFVSIHSLTQVIESWAEYLIFIWSMFSCNTLFKTEKVDSGSKNGPIKTLPFFLSLKCCYHNGNWTLNCLMARMFQDIGYVQTGRHTHTHTHTHLTFEQHWGWGWGGWSW